MTELNFSLDEIREYIETEIPDTEKGELLELLTATDRNEASLDSIGEKFFAESPSLSIPEAMSAMGDMPIGRIDRQKEPILPKLKKEIYKVLCTEKQIKHIANFKDFVSKVIPLIASRLNANQQDITLLVTAYVIFALSSGIINFCENNKCILSEE